MTIGPPIISEVRAAGARWILRLDAFNVLNNDDVVKVDERAESGSGEPDPDYLAPLDFQTPRAVRLGVGIEF